MQREIVLYGPTSFAEADAIPKNLFEEDLNWDRETGDEKFYWAETDLGRICQNSGPAWISARLILARSGCYRSRRVCAILSPTCRDASAIPRDHRTRRVKSRRMTHP
jgi:hypothetical protein